MAAQPTDPLRRFISQLVETQQREQLSDRELLQRFADERDEAAFATLVRRHGQLVLRICRRVLGNREDAEDACQATFLILARKSASRRWQESVGNWLFKVAYRLARAARMDTLRRQACESRVEPRAVADPAAQLTMQDAEQALDEELMHLPEALRLPVILYYLEGRKRAQAAQQLGCSTATLDRRLERALELLRSRLARRGVTLATVLLAAGLARNVWAKGSGLLVGRTVRAAVAFAAHQESLGTGISTQVVTWAEGVLQAMVLTKVKLGVVLLAATLMVGTGSALVCQKLVSPTLGKASPAGQPTQTKALASVDKKTVTPVDVYGDPLPEGALARLGTIRWRHGGVIPFLAFLPDGKSVLSAGKDQAARLWDLATGQELRKFGIGHSFAFALSTSGKILAAYGHGNIIRLYDVATGKEGKPIQGPPPGVTAPAFAPDDQLLAAESDGVIRLWDMATGKELRRFNEKQLEAGFEYNDYTTRTLAFAADGKTLLWTAKLKAKDEKDQKLITVVRVWNVSTGKELSQLKLVGESMGMDSTFSADGKMLAWGSGKSTLCLSNVVTGQEIHQFKLDEDLEAVGLAFSPDGKVLAVRDAKTQVVELWDTATGKRRWRIGKKTSTAYREIMPESPFAFSTDGKMLAIGGKHNTIRLLDVTTGKEIHAVSAHQETVSMVRFGSDGKTLLSQGEDDTTRLWNIHTGKELRQIRGFQGKTMAPVLSQDGRIAAARGRNEDDTIYLWDTATGKLIRRIPETDVSLFALSPDGRWLAVHTHAFTMGGAANMQTVEEDLLFDVATGKKYSMTLLGDNNAGQPGIMEIRNLSPKNFLFSPDSQLLASLSEDSEEHVQLRLWDVATCSLWRHMEFPGKSSIQAVAFAPNGRSLALDVGDGVVSVWEVITGKERCRLKKKQPPLANSRPPANSGSRRVSVEFGTGSSTPRPLGSNLSFSLDGKVLVQGHGDGTISVWDVAAGKELGVLRGHQGKVETVAFASDGRTLASGSSDTTVLIWDLKRWLQDLKLPVQELSDRDLKTRWSELASANAAQAFTALLTLASAPRQAVPFLRQHLQPIQAADAQRIQRLIGDLDSNRFAVRKKASVALEQEGELALPLLRQVLKDKKLSLEVNRRLQELISKLSGQSVSGYALRPLRAVEALEWMGTPEAKQVLQTMAQGIPEATLTRTAQAALKRLDR